MIPTRTWTLTTGSLILTLLGSMSFGEEQPGQDFAQWSGSRDAVSVVNEHVRRVWREQGLQPSAESTDGEWCRRIYLDVIGRIPSVNELGRFLADRSKQKRADLTDRLLLDERYTDEYARNWATIWTNILVGRAGGNGRNSFVNRQGLQDYLRDSFAGNKPYDQLVYELITATGLNRPGMPGFNGAVNFLTMKVGDNAIQATSQTARIFLGLQVQCTQCHNHPFNDWKQNQFWELNAFFRQTAALRRFQPGTNDLRAVELVDQDFGGEGISADPEEAEIYYELRNGLTRVAYPVFVDGTALKNKSGYVSDVNRRKELGKLVVASHNLAEAVVNRMWAHFLGYGFTKPIDDMRYDNPRSHPELLSYLADRFRHRSYNLKELIRWIVLSEPYALSSRSTKSNEADDPALGQLPGFSRFYLRQMRAEELYESLLVATEAHKTGGSHAEQEKVKQQWLRQFTITFGTDEGDETTTFNGSIPQALMMFNGDLIRRATSADQGSFLWQVANSDMKPAKRIDRLYLAGLARRATRKEFHAANKLLLARNGDTTAALQDMWWAILNSNEFILNH